MVRDFLIAISVVLLLGIDDCSAADPMADMYVSNSRVANAWVATFANYSLCDGVRTILQATSMGTASGNTFSCVARP